ncbi:MAG: enoyl-CoA hydratase/isomerase family protein [Hylemonella sp.]|nr:enoyl-CoA hydratase/isomerase family protein [Hylemonella sp.]
MSAGVRFERQERVAQVTLSHAGKFNAMSRTMWRELRAVFESIQRDESLRCVVIQGEQGHFCAGGDIAEYPDFRFSESGLREFHEQDVWGGLQAVRDCDVPIVARIEGNCMGAGVEIASCCDIRIAGESARFGAPIARLGFPMAPREAALVMGQLGAQLTREMLLEAAVFGAPQMLARGFLNRVVADAALADEAMASAARIAALSPQAARLNKRTVRFLQNQAQPILGAPAADEASLPQAYAYADSAQHREGVAAFLEKRKPAF